MALKQSPIDFDRVNNAFASAHEKYVTAKPFPHASFTDLFDLDVLRQVEPLVVGSAKGQEGVQKLRDLLAAADAVAVSSSVNEDGTVATPFAFAMPMSFARCCNATLSGSIVKANRALVAVYS